MKKCKSCKAEIPNDAKKCSHCGTDQRGWFRKHPIITGILVLIVVIAVLSAIGSKSSSPTSSTPSQTTDTSNGATAQPTIAPMVIDATALVGEYDKNKLAAQNKYTDKVIQTTAFIANISNDITGSYYLSLNPSNDQAYFGTSIQCYFNSQNELTSLAKGQSVSVKGTMQDMSLGIVEMKDCSIVK